jgi:hypothetical protein
VAASGLEDPFAAWPEFEIEEVSDSDAEDDVDVDDDSMVRRSPRLRALQATRS